MQYSNYTQASRKHPLRCSKKKKKDTQRTEKHQNYMFNLVHTMLTVCCSMPFVMPPTGNAKGSDGGPVCATFGG